MNDKFNTKPKIKTIFKKCNTFSAFPAYAEITYSFPVFPAYFFKKGEFPAFPAFLAFPTPVANLIISTNRFKPSLL